MKFKALSALIGAVALAATMAAVDTAGAASVREKQSFAIWQQQDKCAKEAFEKFPDYTPAAIRARNAAMHECDAAHGLPPRADLGASAVRRIPDAAAE